MRDFTQEQKGPSGMKDLPFGYEEGLILSPPQHKLKKTPSGMRDFTQEQKSPSGMKDLPFGYEEGLILEHFGLTAQGQKLARISLRRLILSLSGLRARSWPE